MRSGHEREWGTETEREGTIGVAWWGNRRALFACLHTHSSSAGPQRPSDDHWSETWLRSQGSVTRAQGDDMGQDRGWCKHARRGVQTESEDAAEAHGPSSNKTLGDGAVGGPAPHSTAIGDINAHPHPDPCIFVVPR